MKKLGFLFLLLFVTNTTVLMAQNNENYQNDWLKVEEFDKEGLPKSSLEIVQKILDKAKKNNNTNQITKGLIYKAKYVLQLEENAQLNIVEEITSEIEKSKFPRKNILESILANLYWQYFQDNRWQFYNRTKTATKIDLKDFRTWDLATLFEEVHIHFQKSLENGLLAQQTPLESFNDILTTAKDSKKYRPTLFDFLSHNALDFYKTQESNITKPAYAFEIDDQKYLEKHTIFSRLPISTKDSLSLQFHALKIYQSLLNFHARSKSIAALTAINIERLQFVAEHATFSDIKQIILQTLSSEKESVINDPSATLYDYEMAKIYQEQASNYRPITDETYRWELKKAIETCDNAIKKFPESSGAKNCFVLKEQILFKEINKITLENYIPIDQPSRVLVDYKNLDKLYFNIFEISLSEIKSLQKLYRKKEQITFINKLKKVEGWNSELKNEGDYQNHSTEILVPKLAQGGYLVVTSTSQDLGLQNAFAFAPLQVTNLGLTQQNQQDKSIFQVLDRNTGTPIANAQIFLKSNHRRNPVEKKLSTDKQGNAFYGRQDYQTLEATVTYGDDTANFGGFYINKYQNDNRNNEAYFSTFLFTDRAIYRPGQTVHFKGIMMKSKDDEKPTVVANKKTYAKLMDANGQEVSKLDLTTNEFGSFSGTFILPNSGLTGTFTIESYDYQNISFQVEEYKRPKFETTFNPVEQTYKVNDAVTVTGIATAYAGSNITDAKVSYRVQRKVRYPIWCYWFPPTSRNSQEITHGETKTNDKGEYTITFTAQPDLTVKKENQPIFDYEITADVTDINGETRSSTTVVRVGYHALEARIGIQNELDKEQKTHQITIDTKNLNDQPISNQGKITIHKLTPPKYPLRTRPWRTPDYKSISKEEFQKLFPHEAYDKEDNFKNWKKGTLVFEQSYNTDEKGNYELTLSNIKKWESGKYVIELQTKDRFGQKAKDIAYTTVISTSDKKVTDNQLFQITTNKETYKVGDTAEITVASASDDLTVVLNVEKNHKIIQTEYIKLSKNGKTIKVPVTTDDIGGFAIGYSFVNYNSFKKGSLLIKVPYPSAELSIETKTFRDKLAPGQDETWSFMIKGPKGEQVTAELLASMYDASLDQFIPHEWDFSPIDQPEYYSRFSKNGRNSFGIQNFKTYNYNNTTAQYQHQNYDQLNWFGLRFGQSANIMIRGRASGMEMRKMARSASMPVENALSISTEAEAVPLAVDQKSQVAIQADDSLEQGYEDSNTPQKEKAKKPNLKNITIRKNLKETAFFFPKLTTDKDGNVSFNFTAPEALTQWKLQLLAHTKELNSDVKTLESVTQKELMVLPNPPRFLREGDKIVISSKISNLSDKALNGIAILELTDAISGQNINNKLQNNIAEQNFTVDSKGNTQVSWTLQIPDDVQTVQYKIVAKAGKFSDGEQNVLPVLSNRMLVTETLPMWIRSDQQKTFSLNKLKNNTSNSLKHHKLTLEMTSNPAWYAVQALPYLMEYPYECAEQTFSRYYANALASHIANSNPRIQEVFNQWKDTDALLSNLEKNQELKSLILEETPWVHDAQSETEQKKRIALLFDLNKMNRELTTSLRKLSQMQFNSGAFPWFKGGRENRFITQYIVTGFGHLQKLKVAQLDKETREMTRKAITYLDREFVKEYEELKKNIEINKGDLSKNHLTHSQVQYLYMRSFFPENKIGGNIREAWNYYIAQSKKYWLQKGLYNQGMIALTLHRNAEKEIASKIIKSLEERSITSDELGMYWKSNTPSWFWYQAPIETQALLIETFGEIASEPNRTKIIDNLKIWLLKNKQTNRWKTTKATTEAVYALLLQGSDWLSITDMVDITLGDQKINPTTIENTKVEAGTGYIKTSWNASEITPKMATAKMAKKGKGIAWGALYWQYFEDLDKITTAKTPLELKKQLFLKENSDRGEKLTAITSETKLELGDLVTVRIELRSDRAMEFVHMKDMRAAGLEPINVLSQYKYQDGLGYYESTKDAATNFFFDYLPKGVFVFEYDLRVNNKGDFSNGITTIQSMYAPEFSSHSEGLRVIVP